VSFIDWRRIHGFADQLESLLQEIEKEIQDPITGVDLTLGFIKCDQAVFGRCDDSNGIIGDIFRYDARNLFVKYAVKFPDKEILSDKIYKIMAVDDYGIRDSL